MTVWTFGPFTLDEAAGKFARDGVDLKPQPLVVQLLAHAARHPGELLRREDLTQLLWPDVVVTDHSLSQLVHRIRKHLGPHRAWWATVPRRGYRFDAPLQSAPPRLGPRTEGFFGREDALRWLHEAARPGAWLLIRGPGGIGKTRLAREVLRQAGAETLWVGLSDISTRAGLIERFGAELDVQLGGPDDEERVLRVLASRAPSQVVLDNLEQLPAECDAVFDAWRAAAAETTWLATSRATTGVRESQEWVLQPLDPAAAESVFRERTAVVGGEIDASDQEALQIVLDELVGLPLALELAAARTAVLDLPSIAERLSATLEVLRGGDRGPERHRSLDATVRWSWDLLTDREQLLLAHLALFPAGASVQTVERMVTLRGDDPHDVLDGLQRLQRSSLVSRGARWPDGRVLVLHPVVRAFVLTELAQRPDRSTLERAFASVLAERMSRVSEQLLCWDVDRYTVLKADLPNVGEALERVPDAHKLRACGAIAGHLSGRMDANKWLDPTATTPLGLIARAIRSTEATFPEVDAAYPARIDTLISEGQVGLASDLLRILATAAARLGKYPRAVALGHWALELAERSGDGIRRAWAHVPLSGAAMRQRVFSEALAACEGGLSTVPTDTHDRLTSTLLDVQGLVLVMLGRHEEAIEVLHRAHAAAERGDMGARCGSIETNLASLYEQRGDMDAAVRVASRALARFQSLGHAKLHEAVAHNNLGLYEIYRGRIDAARRHLDAARALESGAYVERLLATVEPLWMLHAGQTRAALTAVKQQAEDDTHSAETQVVLAMIRLVAEHTLGEPTTDTEALLDTLPVATMRSGIPEGVAVARAHARGAPLPDSTVMLARSLRRLLQSGTPSS